jgi:DNA-binding XRE family transcriptional regulator
MLDGKTIRNHREHLGITQKELAESAGISPTMVSFIEGNKKDTTASVARHIAKRLGVAVDDLYEAETA